MLVTFSANETYRGEVYTSVTWRHCIAGEYGEATFSLPPGHPALATDDNGEPRYVDNMGGFYVEVLHDALGKWRGIADVPDSSDEGVTVKAFELPALLTIRRVGNAGEYRALPAGAIVAAAYYQAFGGVGRAAISLGDVTLSGPLIVAYRFENQTLAEVLDDLMEMTGMEWSIDDELRLNWHGFAGRYYPFPLADDGDLLDSRRSGSIQRMAISVTSRNSLGHELTTTTLETEAGAWWPAMEVVSP
jgi:hypothetical protein